MSLTPMITAAAESSVTENPLVPWIVGVSILVGLLAMMFALLVFGSGRPHS